MGLFSKFFKKKDDYFQAIILLLSEYRAVDSEILRNAVPEPKGGSSVKIEGHYIYVSAKDYAFKILFRSDPYIPGGLERNSLAERVQDLRLRSAILAHTAFISVYVENDTPEALRANTRRMAAITAAALSDDTVLAIWDADTNRMVIPRDENLRLLADGEWDEAFRALTWDPISAVAPGDLDDEIEEARRRFPEFVKVFEQSGEQEASIVKFGFSDRATDKVEHMWVRVQSITGSKVTGELLNEPHSLSSPRQGDTVTKEIAELTDWMCEVDGELLGGFTEMKVYESLSPKQP